MKARNTKSLYFALLFFPPTTISSPFGDTTAADPLNGTGRSATCSQDRKLVENAWMADVGLRYSHPPMDKR